MEKRTSICHTSIAGGDHVKWWRAQPPIEPPIAPKFGQAAILCQQGQQFSSRDQSLTVPIIPILQKVDVS